MVPAGAVGDPNRREILRLLSDGDKQADPAGRPHLPNGFHYLVLPAGGHRGPARLLVESGDWILLRAAAGKKPAAPGTVEAWGRSPYNPAGGWYGLRKGYRGRFGMYLPPLLEALCLAEVTHDPRNNRMHAITPG